MNQEEMRKEFNELYDMMAMSHDVNNMRTFGNVHKEMMEWMIQNRPSEAQAWIEKLESIRWKNYLTPKEADMIVSEMEPKAPWSKEQWKQVMTQKGYPLEKEPCYNSCALWVAMNMILNLWQISEILVSSEKGRKHVTTTVLKRLRYSSVRSSFEAETFTWWLSSAIFGRDTSARFLPMSASER